MVTCIKVFDANLNIGIIWKMTSLAVYLTVLNTVDEI